MDKLELIEFLKENLRIDVDFSERYVRRVSGVHELSVSITLDGEEITSSKVFVKDGESYATGEDGEPWSASW